VLHSTDYDEMTFSFRVKDIYRQVEIRFISQGEIIYKTRKPIVTPGEMNTITVNKNIVGQIKEDLKIELEVL